MSNEYEELKRRFIAHHVYQRQRVSGVVKFLVVSMLLIMLIAVI